MLIAARCPFVFLDFMRCSSSNENCWRQSGGICLHLPINRKRAFCGFTAAPPGIVWRTAKLNGLSSNYPICTPNTMPNLKFFGLPFLKGNCQLQTSNQPEWQEIQKSGVGEEEEKGEGAGRGGQVNLMILLPLIWPLACDSAVFILMSRKRKYDLCVVSSSIFAIMRCVANCTVDTCKSTQASASEFCLPSHGQEWKWRKNNKQMKSGTDVNSKGVCQLTSTSNIQSRFHHKLSLHF